MRRPHGVASDLRGAACDLTGVSQLTGASVRSGWLAALACRIFCCAPQRKRNALDGFAAGPSETEHMNASFDRSPCRFQLDSGHVVLIDPLALDALSQQLAEVAELPESERSSKLQAFGERGLRIGVQRVSGAAPGMYQIDLDSFEAADASDTDPGVFDIDTGTVIVIDGGALSAVARALTWDRYDALLQAPAGDTSLLTEINREVGGPRFAIVSADAASPFSGDGAFRLKANRLVLLE
jgi:hypothetical protein